MHDVFYLLHIAGMTTLVVTGLILILNQKGDRAKLKRLSLYLVAAAHTQLLTGFTLFFLILSQVNHMKIGIKMSLAVVISILATIYKKKISQNQTPNSLLIRSILVLAILITVIAFAL